MPRFTIQSDDGNTLTLEGDSPPTEQELEELFSQHGQTQMAQADVPQGIESYRSDQSMSPEQFRNRDLAIRTRARTSDAPEFSRANEQGIAFNEIMPKFGVREMLTASASMPMGIGLDPYPKPTEQTIQAAEKVPALQLAAGAVQGTGEIIGGVGQYLTSPQGVGEIALSKTALAPVVMFKWAKDMVESGMVNTAEAIEAYKRKDWPELGRLVANATGMIAGAAGVAHGGMKGARPVIESGVRAVHELTPSGKVSRAERVEAGQWLEGHMQRMAERTALEKDPDLANDPAKQERLDQIITQQEQIGLSEPHQKILDEQAKDLTDETGLPVEVVWGSKNRKPGQTFGMKRGPDGKVIGIEAHGENVPGWMESVAKTRRGASAGKVLEEEFIHSATNPEDADTAYESASSLERKVAEKNYGRAVGAYGRELTPAEQGLVDKVKNGERLTPAEAEVHRKIPKPMSSRDLGYELIRQRVQKMSGGTREAVEASFEDRLDISALDAIASMVRGIRERLGPRGRAGDGKAAFERTLANIEAAKAAKRATGQPEARATPPGEPPTEAAPVGEVTPDAADLALEELGVDPGEFDIEPSDNMGLLRQLEDEISQGPDPRNRPAKGNHLSDRDKFRAKQEQFEKLKAQEMDRLMRDNPAAVQKDLFSDPDKKKILTDSLWAKMRAAAGGDQKVVRKAEAQLKEQAMLGKELPGDNPAAIDTRTGVEEEIPKLPAGDRLVTIERPDGTTYQAAFGDKYWDFPGRGRIESIAKPVNGSWSHGIIGKGEKIVETADNPAAIRKLPDDLETLKKLRTQVLARLDDIYASEHEKNKGTEFEGQSSWQSIEQTLDLITDLNTKISDLGGDNPAAISKTQIEKVARETIIGLEQDAAKYRAAGKHRDADELEGYADTLKKNFPAWQEQSFPAATFKQKQADKLADLRRAAAEGREAPGLKGPGVQPAYDKMEQVPTTADFGLPQKSQSEKLIAPDVSGEVTPDKAQKLASAYMESTDRPSFEDFKGTFQARFGPAPEGALREQFKSQAIDTLANATGDKLEKLVRSMSLEGRFQGRGASPGQRIVGKIADPVEQVSGKKLAQISMDFTPGEGVSQISKKLQRAVKRAQDAIKLEYQYRLASGRTTQIRNELRELGISDVTAKGVPLDLNKKRVQNPTEEIRGKALEILSIRRFMDEVMDPDKEAREGLLYLKMRQTKPTTPEERRMLEEEGMASRPAFEARPPAKTKTFTKAQQRRYHVIATIYDALAREADVGKKSSSRPTVTPDDLGSQLKAKQPVFYRITDEELKRPSDLEERLVADARTSGKKVSLTHRLVALLNKESGAVDLVDVFDEAASNRGVVVMSPVGTGAHQPFQSVLKTHRPLYSVYLDEPVVNFRQRFKSLREFEEKFGRDAAQLSSGSEFAIAGEETPGVTRSGIRLASTTGELERAMRGKLTEREAGAVLEHILGEVGKFESPDDVMTAIESLHESAEREPMNRQNLQVIGGLEKMFQYIRRQFPELSARQALEVLQQNIYDISKSHQYDWHDTRTGLDRTGYFTDKFAQEAVGKYGGQVERPIPEGEGAAPSPTSRELTSPSYRKPIPGTGGPPLRGITGQAARIAQAEAESAATARGEAMTRDIQASPQEESLGTRAVRQSAKLKEEAIAEAEAELLSEGDNPAAISKKASEEFGKLKAVVGAQFKRREAEQNIVRWRDAADNTANITARASGNSIRVRAKNPQVRAAAKAMIAAGYDQGRLPGFLDQINNGIAEANALIQGGNPVDKRAGRLWLKAAQKLKQEVEYANAHWNDDALRGAALQTSREMANEFKFETANGIDLKQSPDYIPGRYDAELFNDNSVMFGEQRILGRNYRKPKTFPNYYAAIAEGPYIPKSYDVAELVEHRVRQGRREINKTLWLESLKTLKDPDSGLSVVADAVKREGKWVSPGPEHELFSMGPGKEPVAVRQGYKNLLDVLTMQSTISKTLPGKVALAATGFLKHGVILILDTFHPGRLFQYAAALHGTEAGYRGGFSALEYRDADLPRAVAQGYITPESAQWAAQPVNVRLANGKMGTVTRRQILELGTKNGLNVGRVQDALYKDLVRNWPVIGKVNNWVFDKMTRGLMSEAFVREFERLNDTEVDPTKLAGKVAKELNIYYGSLGRQGWIRNPTFRDISQILFLAPQWVEGLIQKEARFYGRMSAAPVRMAKGEGAMMGTIGRGVGRGLLSYFVLTQVMNLITRRQTTFQNEEEGHKLDAWIPTGGGDGFWLSPLSVFGEITHDVMRYGESKSNTAEAIRKIGENKLGPWGKLALVFATRENPQGERLTTTASIAGSMGAQLMPTPISLGVPVRSALHTVAPSLVRPPPKGSLPRQMLGSVGIKVQPSSSSVQQINSMASHWVDKNKLRHTGSVTTPTDEPSYSKLRSALLNKDTSTAESAYKFLLETRTRKEVEDEMEQWSNRGFTGLKKEHEDEFRESLNKRDYERYQKAKADKEDLFEKFRDFAIGVR